MKFFPSKFSKVNKFYLLTILQILISSPANAGSRVSHIEETLAGSSGSLMIIAHRACWEKSAENSIRSIEDCIDAGIDMVELDVRTTRDGVHIILHDGSLDRTTNGSGRVDQHDWADIQQLRLREGLGGDAPLTSWHIPTLREALTATKDRILVNLDTKVSLSAEIIAVVDSMGLRDQVLFKAEAPVAKVQAALAQVAQGDGHSAIRFQPILRQPKIIQTPEEAIASFDAIRPVSYEIDVKDVEFARQVAPWIAERCARYWVNSLAGRLFDDREAVKNPEAVWGTMLDLGVTAIQTDEPLALKAFLNKNLHRVASAHPGCRAADR